MIDRTKIQDSIYDILDKDPKEIQKYIDTEAEKTSEQKQTEKEERNKVSNITDVNLQENIDNQEDNPYNKIVIHTEKDNLVHNYFHYFDMYWDAGDPMSNVILKLPKTNKDNTKYWITYTGDITIYLGNEINTEMHKSQPESANETYFTLNTMKPIFKGEIGQIKEYNKELEIHIDSIGKRFKQKIPEEFRQSYINNQNVRDAFQAICPPGMSQPEDEETEEENPSGDGTENNVDSRVQQEQQLASEARNIVSQTSNNIDENGNGLQNNQTSHSSNENTNTENSLNGTTNEDDIQKGFKDISFDANGTIVHNSTVIETSPNLEKTLLSIEESPLEQYLTDTTFVATDVKRFLDGEMFETVHNNIMNYGAITIQPTSAPTSNISNISSSINDITTSDNLEEANEALINSHSNDNNNSSSSGKNGWIGGQLYENGKISLSKEYIRTLTKEQAALKYKTGKNTYTQATLNRLFLRSTGDKMLR